MTNATMESSWSTLKLDLLYRTEFENKAQTRQTVSESVKVFYNRQRLHSSRGNCSPVQFETCPELNDARAQEIESSSETEAGSAEEQLAKG